MDLGALTCCLDAKPQMGLMPSSVNRKFNKSKCVCVWTITGPCWITRCSRMQRPARRPRRSSRSSLSLRPTTTTSSRANSCGRDSSSTQTVAAETAAQTAAAETAAAQKVAAETAAAQTAAAETAAAVKNYLSKTFRENSSHVMANLSTVGYVHCPAANVLSIWLVA